MTQTQINGQVISVTVYDSIRVDGLGTDHVNQVENINSSKREYKWRKCLLRRVEVYWIEEHLKTLLHRKVLIELGLEKRFDLVQRPFSHVREESLKKSGEPLPEGTRVIDFFNQMGEGRTLLILGEPGSGKTTTLVKLAQSLIARIEKDPTLPIPVVFDLSLWANKRETIAKWLVEVLFDEYGITDKSICEKWIKEEQLILLLDGLDEVKAEHRNNCLLALNQFIQSHGMTEIVVCCRIQEYQAISNYLKLQDAICIKTLTAEQIYEYLEQFGEQLVALKTLLQQDIELLEFAKSPLILSVMSLVYQGCLLEDLPQPASLRENFHQKLFDAYIEKMFERRRSSSQQYKKSQAKYWLAWLASKMVEESQTKFVIEGIKPEWLNFRQYVLYGISTSLITGFSRLPVALFITGLFFGMIMLSLDNHDYLKQNIHHFVKIYLATALILSILFEYFTLRDIKFIETLQWSWINVKEHIKWLLQLLFNSEHTRLKSYTTGCLNIFIFGPIIFPLWVLIIVFGIPTSSIIIPEPEKEKIVPNQSVWKSLKNSIIGVLIGVLIGGLIVEAFYWWIYFITPAFDPEFDFNFYNLKIVQTIKYLFIGLSGLIGWVSYGGRTCIQHFYLRLILTLKGYTPWNYARFLKYAQ
ncbi:NACHT domain-containing protein [Plectonema cf. radiosum LEGE 06105]|uniref:NACHT domain-containing protein n=1 Tax=Plectonema cf. radiosum LEGE 06105 TaxID=945769 RepID=A0A8J7K2P5_9CYAN|nr:NACHT domain-containing protein [Plectonema radiosum]MBE9214522.1 NACHT domain-containing protein [Plectonema cf. radiosum LEGE 06105]